MPSLAFIALAAPLALGLVPPNRFYGVRTPKTLSDRDVWLKANRLGGLLLMTASAVYVGVAWAAPAGSTAPFGLWLLHLAAFTLPLSAAAAALLYWLKGNRAP